MHDTQSFWRSLQTWNGKDVLVYMFIYIYIYMFVFKEIFMKIYKYFKWIDQSQINKKLNNLKTRTKTYQVGKVYFVPLVNPTGHTISVNIKGKN